MCAAETISGTPVQRGANLLFVLSGSIACYKACDAISRLVQAGHRVRAVATASALRFVGAATLEGLTGERVSTDLFEEGGAMAHINLTRWADAVIVCPATASLLNRMAAGIGDDLAGALLLARDRTKPMLVAPAMNPAMWTHPATVASVARLREWGVRFIEVGAGRTACGELGEGRLAEPAGIVAAVQELLAPPARRLRVLVTSGGTSEPIDGVRVLTNVSTGRTGASIADALADRGHQVLLLRARNAVPGSSGSEQTYGTFAELESALTRLLGTGEFDAVIHAAAVGDFSIDAVLVDGRPVTAGAGKLGSGHVPEIRLRRNPKLVDKLRRLSPRPLEVVAFKLTRGATPEAVEEEVRALFAHSAADLVVHNDLSRRSDADAFPATIHRPDGALAATCATRQDLALALERLLTGRRAD